MNKPIMKRFYDIVMEGDKYNTALSLRAMVDDLIVYRVERIVDAFKNDPLPFHRIGNWEDCDAFFMVTI
jgi:hypothetical protein